MSFNKEARYLLLFRRTAPLGLDGKYVISRVDVDNAFFHAKQSAYHDALAWLKTVTNGWCTSRRMHEPVLLPCIFGCSDASDTISHYLEYMILWSIIDEVFHGYVHPLSVGRVNYLDPNPNRVIVISAAFEVYHALKIGLRDIIDSAICSKMLGQIYRVSHKLIVEKFAIARSRLQ